MLKDIVSKDLTLKSNTAVLPSGIRIHYAVLSKVGEGMPDPDNPGQQNEALKRRALFIHGGGFTGNHTLSLRPSKHLLRDGLFDEVIMPDRRGAGLSSPFTRITSFKDQALDMKGLLEYLDITSPLTAIGVSYGGPVALHLAAMDKRIERVILLASSPTLKHAAGLLRLMIRTGYLSTLLKPIFRLFTGRGKPRLTNQDAVYDTSNTLFYAKIFVSTLIHSPKDMLSSYMLQAESFTDKDNLDATGFRLDIPVLQVIGDKDEFWGRHFPEEMKGNYPFLTRCVIKNAGHKAAFLRADEFHNEVARYLKESNK